MSQTIGFQPLGVDQGTITFSSPDALDLEIYQGDSGRFRIKVVDGAGAPLDVTTATWDADIRDEPHSQATIAVLTVTPVVGETDAADVILSATESAKLAGTTSIMGTLVWDLQMTLNGEVTTLFAGVVTVVEDVSRNP